MAVRAGTWEVDMRGYRKLPNANSRYQVIGSVRLHISKVSCFKKIWNNLCQQYFSSGNEAESWRQLSFALVRRLRRHRLGAKEIQEGRQSIDNEDYWEPDAAHLKDLSTLQEHEILEKYRATTRGSQRAHGRTGQTR